MLQLLQILPNPSAAAVEENGEEAKSTDEVAADKPAEWVERITGLRSILSGDLPQKLHIYFLHRENRVDQVLLRNIQTAAGNRDSVLHNMCIISHGYEDSFSFIFQVLTCFL